MRTFLFRYEIGKLRGVARVDAKSASVAKTWATLLVLRKSGGAPFMLFAINH